MARRPTLAAGSESPSGMLGLLKTSLVLATSTVYGKAQLRVMSQLDVTSYK